MNPEWHREPLVPTDIADALHAELRATAEDILETVPRQLPVFADLIAGDLGEQAAAAIKTMLAGFLVVACGPRPGRRAVDLAAVQQAAYELGRFEAQSGRSIDAMNAAFRLGARIGWRHWSATSQAHGMSTSDIARLAELNFDYIDNLADASVSGHADELASAGQRRQRLREQLAEQLLLGAASEEVLATALLAGWQAPDSMVAVVLPRADARNAIPLLDHRTLQAGEDLLSGSPRSGLAVLLVPVTAAVPRGDLIRRLADIHAAVGPEQPWLDVQYSATLAARAWGCCERGSSPIDTENVLAALVIHADPRTRERQRAAALEPFAHLRPDTRARYEETLHAWLLHQGRREDVARYLVLHPQTVRYRMDRIREILGEDLTDPQRVLDLTIALA
ncbi:PucR family transcriptional regulator [Nocardia pseudovaccinii]|uniref:PucR family transcriptional regulator n=1 Tax=Nocardia pseudovaccinii TaxID=189540 RepID=UPI0007A411DA|nr:helix-turn-helix domain-containing protein [Nocardia pseudovaccinii]